MANVGSTDRVARAVIGILLILAPFVPVSAGFFAAMGTWKLAVALVGLVLVTTAALRFCPLYALLGLNTCPVERR